MRGIIVAVLLFVVSFLGPFLLERFVKDVPDSIWRWGGFLMTLAAILVALLSDPFYGWVRDFRTHPLGSTATIGTSAGLFVAAIWFFLIIGFPASSPTPPSAVHEAFLTAYNENKMRLGEPASAARDAENVHQDAHEHALVLWVLAVNTIYKLPDDVGRKWESENDIGWDPHSDWSGREHLTKIFNPPDGKNPPWAGTAYHWAKNKAAWEWIGWLRWAVAYNAGECVTQRFERGRIIGPLRLSAANDARPQAQVIIICDDGTWNSVNVAGITAKGHAISDDLR